MSVPKKEQASSRCYDLHEKILRLFYRRGSPTASSRGPRRERHRRFPTTSRFPKQRLTGSLRLKQESCSGGYLAVPTHEFPLQFRFVEEVAYPHPGPGPGPGLVLRGSLQANARTTATAKYGAAPWTSCLLGGSSSGPSLVLDPGRDHTGEGKTCCYPTSLTRRIRGACGDLLLDALAGLVCRPEKRQISYCVTRGCRGSNTSTTPSLFEYCRPSLWPGARGWVTLMLHRDKDTSLVLRRLSLWSSAGWRLT